MLINWYRFSSPVSFYPLAGTTSHVFGVLAALFAGAGLFVALYAAPTDATQGDAYRIIYVHVPAAWMAMFIYIVMAIRNRISGVEISLLYHELPPD